MHLEHNTLSVGADLQESTFLVLTENANELYTQHNVQAKCGPRTFFWVANLAHPCPCLSCCPLVFIVEAVQGSLLKQSLVS